MGAQMKDLTQGFRLTKWLLEEIPDWLFDGVCMIFGLCMILIVKYKYFSGVLIVSDSMSQIIQAKMMQAGLYTLSVPDALAGIIRFPNGVNGLDVVYSQYPPGWILILYLLSFFNLEMFGGVIIGVATLPVLRWCAGSILSRAGSRLCEILLCLSPFWMIMSAEGMNHCPALLFLLLVIGFLFRLEKMGSIVNFVEKMVERYERKGYK